MTRTMVKSRTGYILKYAGCPVMWTSKMQMERALSTTEAELIAMGEGLRTLIPLMRLMVELLDQGVHLIN